jgi:hypothetical protein
MKALPSRKVAAESPELERDLIPSPGWRAPGGNPPAKPPSHGAEGAGGQGTPNSVGGGSPPRPAVRGY